MSGHGDKFSRKQETALAALISCATITEAAKTANIGEATLRRWMHQPAFSERYRAARQQLLSNTIGALQKATEQAVAALCRNLECGQPSVEVNAARVLLGQTFKATELYDIMQRVELLEAGLSKESINAQ